LNVVATDKKEQQGVPTFGFGAYYYSALASYQKGEFSLALEEALSAARFPHQNLPHLDLLPANCCVKLKEPAPPEG